MAFQCRNAPTSNSLSAIICACTLDRFATVRVEFPGYTFSPKDIVTYPFQAADDEFARFAISNVVVEAKDNGQSQMVEAKDHGQSPMADEKNGKEDRRQKRTAKKKKR